MKAFRIRVAFHKTLEVPEEDWNEASIRITADSRYGLTLMDNRLEEDRRSWPFEQSNDTYDIKHLLHKGKLNTIAVFVDASIWDSSWVLTNYDDTSWEQATFVGPVGMEPWTTLKKRDIPLLTEETKYPVRVESLNQIESFIWTTAIDLRNHRVPGSEEHAEAFYGVQPEKYVQVQLEVWMEIY